MSKRLLEPEMGDVVDLCDSDEELPSLAARLLKREAPGGRGARLKQQQQQAPGAAHLNTAGGAATRPPLSTLLNHTGGPACGEAKLGNSGGKRMDLQPLGGGSDLLAGAEALRRRQQARKACKAAQEAAAAAVAAGSQEALEQAAVDDWQSEPLCILRPQYHAQEQQPQRQLLDGVQGSGPAAAQRRPPCGSQRQQQLEPWELLSWQQQMQQTEPLEDGDKERRPPTASQPTSQGPAAGDVCKTSLGREGQAVKQRRRRTKEEIERDGAVQAQQKEDRKALRAAGAKKNALQQVKLLVDVSLMSSGGGGGAASLGVNMLASLDEHNRRISETSAEKRIQYEVAALDLAPFKALRWQRKRLVEAGGGGGAVEATAVAGPSQQLLASQDSSMLASQLEEQWEQALHVMVCFQPQEFIEAVQLDRLASLLALLERRAPGQRPYLLVCGLAHHIELQEVRQHRAAMQAPPAAGGAPVQPSVKAVMEEFVTELAVRCPRLGFRDVVDPAQAAQHVQLLTAAIAAERFKETDATVWLRAHDRTSSQAMTNMLIHNPLEDPALDPFLRSITAVPTVKPGVAHVLATRYRSLGGLMDMLLDPTRSDAEKQKEIAEEWRVSSTKPSTSARAMRVGPAAARQLLELLRSTDPDLRIKNEAREEGGADGRSQGQSAGDARHGNK